MQSPSAAPHTKVYAAGIGASIAAPLSIILLYIAATYWNFKPPSPVSDAITAIITTVVSLVSAYLTPPTAADIPVPALPKGLKRVY